MVNITIQNLEVESTALNQVSSGDMEKVIGGFVAIGPFSTIVNEYIRANLVGVFADALFFLLDVAP